jgi:uncharacterized protein YxjI
MIFCRKCGQYNPDGAVNCKKCTAALSADGHSSFQGAALKITARPKGVVAPAPVAPAPAPVPEVVPEPLPEPAPAAARAEASNPEIYNRDKFLLRQPAKAINEKYYVTDEYGVPIAFIERPALIGKQIVALAATAGVFFAGAFVITFIAGFFGPLMGTRTNLAVASGGFLVVVVVMAATFFELLPKRHVTFYTDDTKTTKLLEIKQVDNVELLYANFDILDAAGNALGKLRKNMLFDVMRRRWHCKTAGGLDLFTAKEDSVMLSLLRRIGLPMRTNFIFWRGDDVIGEFNRKLTLLDRYVLDMTADSLRTVDRRIALAMGVMLDTGERR